jgi:hypothetical protein|tara:strand:- start:1251 stop:1859 length:609 start_codon:yes stop_codon:yes gene_type:complete
MNKKFVLREYYALCDGGVCHDLLTEDEKRFVKDGGMMLSGKLQEAEVQNGNGRVYPQETLSREVKNYQKVVGENRAIGELDHPDDSVVNLRNASHMVTDIWMEDKSVMGKLKVLDTPSGNILRSLVDSGVQLGISSRGLGSVTEAQGAVTVNDDFQLICFDMVSEPSTPGAYMALQESKLRSRDIFTKADRINRALNEALED